MKVTDLTIKYIEHVLEADNVAAYESSYPAVFDHYFKYWADHEYPQPDLSAHEIIRKTKSITSRLDDITCWFNSRGVDLSELDIVLLVGRDTSNGHAFLDNGKFVVWLPVETYNSMASIDVFVTHEIIHALHYQKRAEFYFDNFNQFHNPMRQLITEGLATCLSAFVLDADDRTVLWADYLSNDQLDNWFNECEKRARELKSYFKQAVKHRQELPEFFRADNPDNIMQYRGGYFLGLRLAQSFIKSEKIQPLGLLDVDRAEFEKYVRRWLAE